MLPSSSCSVPFTRPRALSVEASKLPPLSAEFFHLYSLRVFAFSLNFIVVLYIALLGKFYSIFVCSLC